MSYEIKFRVARETLSLVKYCERHFPDYPLVEAGNEKWYGRCPLHQEQEGQSFSLDEVTGRWWCRGKCQAHAGDISELEFWRMGGKATPGNTRFKAVDRLLAEGQLYAHEKGKKKTYTWAKPEKNPFNVWPWRKHLQPFPDRWIRDLAKQRGLRAGAVRRAIREGLLWYIDSRQGPAWVVTDVLQKQAVWRRLDGEKWDGVDKARLLPGCSGKTPIGVEEAREHHEIHVVEGGPDMLALWDYLLLVDDIGVVVMPNANSGFDPESTLKLTNKEIWIYAHQDEAGQKAAKRWLKQLQGMREANLFPLDGKKDLNEWLVSRRRVLHEIKGKVSNSQL